MIGRPELLSPTGNWECLRAAVANRADAIYFGLERFSARLRAGNFHAEELPEIMGYLHRYGVRGPEAGHLIRLYRRLLRGEIPGEEVCRDLRVHPQLGVTKGTME